MRRALLALILLGGCGPARYEEIIPRYAIVTTIGPESPMHRPIEWLSNHRYAPIYHIRDLERDGAALRFWLVSLAPTYVAVVLQPQELDANFQLAFLDIACRLDDDPFPDFAYGYFLAPDLARLQRQIESLRGIEAKVEKRIRSVTTFHPGAPGSREHTDLPPWAPLLSTRLVSVKDGDLKFLRDHLPDIEECDFLLMVGEGSPEGLRGLPREELDRLRLDGTVICCAASSTGAAGVVYDDAGGLVQRRTVPVDRSFLLTLLSRGAPAVFAPLDLSSDGFPVFEWSDALLSDEPLGWVMKHEYDLAILSSGASTPSFDRFAEGKKAPAQRAQPFFQAATRVLYGDPMLKPGSRRVRQPVQHVDTFEDKGPGGERILHVCYRVDAPECLPYFTDPFSTDQRIYLRIRLPRDARGARAELKGCKHQDQTVPSKLTAQAVEEWRGDAYVHVLVHGKELARQDLLVYLTLTLR